MDDIKSLQGRPAPLVAANIDLTSVAEIPMDARKLRDSMAAIKGSAEAFRAGMLLRCASWHQVPCGSLPVDDEILSHLAAAPGNRWQKVKEAVLADFVLCSDGRLYHPELATSANALWAKKQNKEGKSGSGDGIRPDAAASTE